MVLVPALEDAEAERAVQWRDDEETREAVAGTLGTMTGHFAVFNRWTEIDSFWEGNFLERIAPGAAKKTIRESGPRGANVIRSLFQHGRDPQVGSKPLGPYERLEEDSVGIAYDVPLLDTSYNRDLVPGLQHALYGASFRFRVTREEFDQKPGESADNPKGLPERTIKEMQVFEGGPVTFPAYADATAGMRSLTDEFIVERALSQPERLRRILDHLERTEAERAARAAEEPPEDETAAPADAERDDEPEAPAPADTTTDDAGRRPTSAASPAPSGRLRGLTPRGNGASPWRHI